jgi:adenylate cyclase
MSGDAEQEYFSDGVSEDIITDLSKVSALSVVARNTAFTFKGKNVEVPQIARQLNVGYVLEGSVRKAGNRVRITAQLIDGAKGDHVWAERFDRDLDDIFALQDEISQAIVAALKLKLLPEEKKAIERRGTESVEAYDLYLMARQEFLIGQFGARPYEALIRLCQRAVEVDPNYAQAWALMAVGRLYRRAIIGEAGLGGLEEANRALALNNGLAEGHAAKAWVLSVDRQFEEASEEIALALRLDPDSHEVNEAAARTAFAQHKFEEAAGHWERAAELIEQDTTSPTMLITCYHALGRKQDLQRVGELQLTRVEKLLAHDRNDGRVLGHGCLALAVLGQEDRAKEWMNRAMLIDPDNINMRYNFACTLTTFLNAKDAALEMLEPVFQKGGPGLLSHAKVDPDLDDLREDPRFQAMVAGAEARLAAAPAGATAAG